MIIASCLINRLGKGKMRKNRLELTYWTKAEQSRHIIGAFWEVSDLFDL